LRFRVRVERGTGADVGQLRTRNFARENNALPRVRDQPAMTPEECEQAIEIGHEQVRRALEQGVQLLGIGESILPTAGAIEALYLSARLFRGMQGWGVGAGL